MSDAVKNDRADAIRLMVDLGFDLSWEEAHGGTPLHTAAWLGKVDLVKALVALGAPVNQRDQQFGSSPLGWTAHGSSFEGGNAPEGNFVAIVDLLIDAGATREAAINKWGEPPEGMATSTVRTRLHERGFVPPGPAASPHS